MRYLSNDTILPSRTAPSGVVSMRHGPKIAAVMYDHFTSPVTPRICIMAYVVRVIPPSNWSVPEMVTAPPIDVSTLTAVGHTDPDQYFATPVPAG